MRVNAGETVVVLEATLSEEVPGRPPIVKVRIDVKVPLRPQVAGWVPLTGPGGKVLMQPTGLPRAAPAPAPAAPAATGSSVDDDAAAAIDLPEAGAKFKVIVPTAVVRKGFATTTSQAGTLQKFEQVVCLEAKLSEEIPGTHLYTCT
jgi:hypothetical protein